MDSHSAEQPHLHNSMAVPKTCVLAGADLHERYENRLVFLPFWGTPFRSRILKAGGPPGGVVTNLLHLLLF